MALPTGSEYQTIPAYVSDQGATWSGTHPLSNLNTNSASTFGDATPSSSSDGHVAPSPVEADQVISRHPEYYLDDGNIVFLVEKTLFKVHRHFLITQSPVFKDMLSMPLSIDESLFVEGLSDEHPIKLHGDNTDDFTSLLWMFYNPAVTTYEAPVARWKGVLALADKYQMDRLHTAAVRALDSMPDALTTIEKISLCEKYNIEKEWAMDAYFDICKRRAPLTAAEGTEIGSRVWALIAEAREELISTRGLSGSSSQFASFPSSNSQGYQIANQRHELLYSLTGMPWPGSSNHASQRDLSPNQKELIKRIMLK